VGPGMYESVEAGVHQSPQHSHQQHQHQHQLQVGPGMYEKASQWDFEGTSVCQVVVLRLQISA
jgi:hypothetical protein